MQARRLILQCRQCLQRLSESRRVLVQPVHSRLLASEVGNVATTTAAASSTSEVIPPPPLDGKPRDYPNKVRRIVDDIAQLTLLETSQLNDLLKTTLNIPDAPVMAMGAMPAAAPTTQSTPDDSPEEQISFTVNLVKFAPESKIKLIKEVKAQTEGMNLVQAKKFVDSLPQVMKSGISKEDAKKLAAALEAVGGAVEVV